MRDLMPRARSFCADTKGKRTRGTERAHHALRGLAGVALLGFLVTQSACPIVAALSTLAPEEDALVVAMQSEEDCEPCNLAGTGDCWEELLRWIESQFNGDPNPAFPSPECFTPDDQDEGHA